MHFHLHNSMGGCTKRPKVPDFQRQERKNQQNNSKMTGKPFEKRLNIAFCFRE